MKELMLLHYGFEKPAPGIMAATGDRLELTNEQLVPSLGGAMSLGPYFPQVLNWSFGQPVSGLPGHAAFRPPPELDGLLGLRHFFVQFAAEDLAGLLESLDRAVGLLEREIEDR